MEILGSRQLLAFQELARQGSFTAAARNLNLTQSAVSHSIKALERTLETALFERLGKTVRLTRTGETLLPHADRILSHMVRAQDELQVLDRPGHGRLRIGATVTIRQPASKMRKHSFSRSKSKAEISLSKQRLRAGTITR